MKAAPMSGNSLRYLVARVAIMSYQCCTKQSVCSVLLKLPRIFLYCTGVAIKESEIDIQKNEERKKSDLELWRL